MSGDRSLAMALLMLAGWCGFGGKELAAQPPPPQPFFSITDSTATADLSIGNTATANYEQWTVTIFFISFSLTRLEYTATEMIAADGSPVFFVFQRLEQDNNPGPIQVLGSGVVNSGETSFTAWNFSVGAPLFSVQQGDLAWIADGAGGHVGGDFASGFFGPVTTMSFP